MLQRCSSNTTSFSLLFPMYSSGMEDSNNNNYYYSSSSSSSCSTPSAVDCTLSLGTPSTRQSSTCTPNTTHQPSPSSFCWDIITQSKSQQQQHSNSRNASTCVNSSSNSNLGGDPLLLARRCANCDTTSTPLWRNGPRGPKSLCNACGIRYKKEERRAAASTASTASNVKESMSYSTSTGQCTQQYPWGTSACYPSASASGTVSNSSKSWCQNDHDDPMDAPNYLSWRLNVNVVPPHQFSVTDHRPSLFQYQ